MVAQVKHKLEESQELAQVAPLDFERCSIPTLRGYVDTKDRNIPQKR